ncbi:MAG TPA: hypothetical protein PKE52_09020, partial [Bacteroidales bacterium]|nr:hypothetical protein [Bacteroidales bacterium]
IVLGLISAGLSTIEGLIQSLSTTITSDIFRPVFGRFIQNDERYIIVNRVVIVLIAIAAYFASYQQIISPNLSVAIFAQNGVYSFFSIAFVPIVFGIFLKDIRLSSALVGSMTALGVYFFTYYLSPWLIISKGVSLGFFDHYFSGKVQNPAIAASFAIVISVAV